LLLNLVSASNAHEKNVLWGFISRYAPGVSPETHPELDRLTEYALRYFDDFVKPSKRFRAPDGVERQALQALRDHLSKLPEGADGRSEERRVGKESRSRQSCFVLDRRV